MSRRTTAVVEWIRPGRIRRPSIPPLEAGFRPNSRLDEAEQLAAFGDRVLEDVVVSAGRVTVAVDEELLVDDGGGFTALARAGGRITAVAADAGVVAAVEGRGLLRWDGGTWHDVATDDRLRSCITAVAALPDDGFLVAIGSTRRPASGWADALVAGESDGVLVRVRGGHVEVLDGDLPWPAGVALDGPDGFLVSLSFGHRIERRPLADPRTAATLLGNLAGYPGRIAPSTGGWWVAMPYMRNRACELLLSEPAMLAEMVAGIEPGAWLVPTLGTTKVHRIPLQAGQVRVMGTMKPWAPPRSYGLAFLVDGEGRVHDSVHSRAGGDAHGVTGVAVDEGRVVLACQGAGRLLRVVEGPA